MKYLFIISFLAFISCADAQDYVKVGGATTQFTNVDTGVVTINPPVVFDPALNDFVGDTGSEIYRTAWFDGFAIVRYIPTTQTWEILDDASHTPYNALSVTSSTTGNGFTLNINNPSVSRKIGSVYVVPDETIAKKFLYAGASFGLNFMNVPVIAKGYSLRLNGLNIINVNDMYPADLTLSYDNATSRLTISHPNSDGNGVGGGNGVQGVSDYDVNISPSAASNWIYYKIVNGSTNVETTTIEFYNTSDQKVQPSGEWYFGRSVAWGPTNDMLNRNLGLGTTGNFWIGWRLIGE